MKLTNERTVISFTQYGETVKMSMNGSVNDAAKKLKLMTGISKFDVVSETKSEGFLPVGYCSFLTN